MGFSRKEVHFWLETASDVQLRNQLEATKEMVTLLTDDEQIKSIKWLRNAILTEIQAREEAKSI